MTGSAILISLKIGRQVYDITEADRFLDNGACIQILTQRGKYANWHYTTPMMTKKAIREISEFARVNHPHKYGECCTVFSLQNGHNEAYCEGMRVVFLKSGSLCEFVEYQHESRCKIRRCDTGKAMTATLNGIVPANTQIVGGTPPDGSGG
jgi:hypothetical protein